MPPISGICKLHKLISSVVSNAIRMHILFDFITMIHIYQVIHYNQIMFGHYFISYILNSFGNNYAPGYVKFAKSININLKFEFENVYKSESSSTEYRYCMTIRHHLRLNNNFRLVT